MIKVRNSCGKKINWKKHGKKYNCHESSDDGLLTGPTGPTGPNGQNGAVGPTGQNGSVGPTGQNGSVGPTGQNGAVGPTGPNGQNGSVGPTGPSSNGLTEIGYIYVNNRQTLPSSAGTTVAFNTSLETGFPPHPSFNTNVAANGFEILSAGVYTLTYQLVLTNNSLGVNNPGSGLSNSYIAFIVAPQIATPIAWSTGIGAPVIVNDYYQVTLQGTWTGYIPASIPNTVIFVRCVVNGSEIIVNGKGMSYFSIIKIA